MSETEAMSALARLDGMERFARYAQCIDGGGMETSLKTAEVRLLQSRNLRPGTGGRAK